MRALHIAVAAALVASGAAEAETLRDALVRAYTGNPTLTGARARLRGIDEGVAIARAEGLPQIGASASLTQQFSSTSNARGGFGLSSGSGSGSGSGGGGGGRVLSIGPSVSLPLFSGGRVRNGIRAADARVVAGRADLRTTEGNVFTNVAGAYMDVLRDEAIVSLNRGNVKVLETNLQASRDRFEVGDLTRTDVAQSEARLAGAHSQLAAAEGRLTSSRESYRQLVGSLPIALQPPPPLPTLPAAPDAAVDIAIASSPSLAAAEAARKAAGFDVGVARAGRLPALAAVAGTSYTNYLGSANRYFGVSRAIPLDQSFNTSQVGVSATIPLYQGGATAARVRQARAAQSEAIELSVAVEREVVAGTRSAYASYVAASETIASSQSAVSANRLALEGVRAENSVGTRDVLDVLNAEQELLNSEVTLVTAKRDVYVAGFALLNAMGQAEAANLGLDGGALYDPTVNYRRSRASLSDWSDGTAPKAEAQPTLGGTTSPVTAPAN